MAEVVNYSISDYEMSSMYGRDRHVPFEVKMRHKLNREGFKFADDGLLSSAINENPEPLGKLEVWYDKANCVKHYRQTINDDQPVLED